jgi:hypothetical protein
MGRFSCIRTAPIPILEINFDFNKLNTFSYSLPHLNSTDFLIISVNFEANILNGNS